MVKNSILEKYNSFCNERKNDKKYRELFVNAKENLIDFSSNDYLCLGSKNNLDAIEFASGIAKKYGVGATGSRLLSGNNDFIMNFEKQIAHDKETEKALIFNSGYQANISTLSSLCNSKILGKKALVFFDKSNHSSLYQAIFLSKADLIRYQHNNLEQLEDLLKENANKDQPKFIVSETIFGMDGDMPNLDKLVELSLKYDALLYLDEAHATGLYGKNGYGLASKYMKFNKDIVVMGTFSKAIGSSGGYIASSKNIVNYLINNAPGFIYSTALSPISVAISKFNWDKISSDEMKITRENLIEKSKYIKNKLIENEIKFLKSDSNIILIECNSSEESLKIKDYLYSIGFIVSAIRPPTTISPRIRIALNSQSSYQDIGKFVENINLFFCAQIT